MNPCRSIPPLILALAITLAAGSTARAESNFTSDEVGATVESSTVATHVMTITGTEVKCNQVDLDGVTEAIDAETLRVVPTFKECSAFGLPGGTVANEYCVYVMYAGGQLTIDPTAPKSSCQLVITASSIFGKCKVLVKNQAIPKAISYVSNPVEGTFGATGMAAEVTESTGVCPLSVGSHKTGTYKGKSRLRSETTILRWHADSNRFTASILGATLVESSISAHTFTFNSSGFTCKYISFAGTTTALESSTLSVVPTYEGCAVFGFPMEVVNEGCRYVIHATGELVIDPISPASNCLLRFTTKSTFGNCEIQIPDQEVESLGYTNGSSDLEIDFELLGTEAEVTKSSGTCPFKAGVAAASYSGESTFQASGGTLGWQA